MRAQATPDSQVRTPELPGSRLPVYIRQLTARLAGSAEPLLVAELLGLLVSAPLLLFPRPLSVIALVLFPALWLARLIVYRRRLHRTPADIPLAGLMFMTCVSLYPSVDLSLSRPKLYGLILGFYVFGLAVQYAATAQRRRVVAAGLLMGGLVVSIIGLIGTNWNTSKIPGLDRLYQRLPHLITSVQTSFSRPEAGIHPNEIGGTIALLLPFVAAAGLFSMRWWPRILSAALAVLMAGTLILTASRSGLAGVSVALMVLLLLRWPRLVLAVPAVVAGAAVLTLRLGPERVGAGLLAIETANGSSALGRLEVWDRALSMIQDFPFTGIGLNTFPVVLDTFYPLFSAGPEAQLPHAHNLFLQTAVDLGVPGLLCFLALLIAAGLSLVRDWRRGAVAERWLVAGLGAGLLGHLIYSLTDTVALGAKPGIFLWTMLGTALALRTPETPRSPGGGLWTQWGVFSLACGLGVAIAATGIRMFPI